MTRLCAASMGCPAEFMFSATTPPDRSLFRRGIFHVLELRGQMHRIPTLLAALAIPLIAAAAPPGREALLALASKTACEQPAPGHVVFAGDSAGLGACLGKVKG